MGPWGQPPKVGGMMEWDLVGGARDREPRPRPPMAPPIPQVVLLGVFASKFADILE